MSDEAEIQASMRRLVGRIYSLPSGNVLRVSRAFPVNGGITLGCIYEGVHGAGFDAMETKTVELSPAFLLTHGVAF